MKKKLSNIIVNYDEKTGVIEITSKDPQVKGKPFQLKVASNTPTYQTLAELFGVEYDTSSNTTLDAPRSSFIAGQDERIAFSVGKALDGALQIFDLDEAPHSLILGGAGSGKSILERAIIAHALASDSIELRAIDLKRVEFAGIPFRPQDRVATLIEPALEMLEDTLKLVYARYEQMEEESVNNFRGLKDSPAAIYIVIDEVAGFGILMDENENDAQIKFMFQQTLERLLIFGRAAGVFLFTCSQSYEGVSLSNHIKRNYSRRVVVGNGRSRDYQMAFEEPQTFGGVYLQTPGRAIVKVNNKPQELLQIRFILHESLDQWVKK